MFLIIKKRTIFVIIAILLLAAGGVVAALYLTPRQQQTAAIGGKVVVIDAGHGGIDGGVVGKNGTVEAKINLAIAGELKAELESRGIKVVMTRTTDEGLYGEATTRKQRDMAERKRIIKEAQPNAVVSIHCNRYPGADRRGAQVFFDEFNESGRALADSLQNSLNELNKEYAGKTFAALKGDYYILKCDSCPSALVECGFLSNAEDEKLLNDPSYRRLLVKAIADGLTV